MTPEITDSTATDSGINEDDEYHDSLTIVGAIVETPIYRKDSEGLVPEATDNVVVVYQYERDNTQEPPSDATDSEEMHIEVRDSIDLTRGIATSTTNSDSQRGAKYWDPISDTRG